ncbi:L-threonylcarbamoyladenylate synthase [Sneathiella glossodoripedis]|uniref:L-threonylcarbamoyladenylate synthase n=1 Tax=Sneathiella glossodoripedis TaxID=418853 RepID=UPI0004724696|nr:L-threonylcarbamoyladenylate synthase [Sneathiella glossodoripedis]
MSEKSNVKPITEQSIREAALLLREAKLVSFPTETVYGLGADATNDVAVAKIFEAKGRPSFNPLIVHVPSIEIAKSLVKFNDTALKIAAAFWPGPLTMVLPRRDNCPISRLASAGLDTLAVRIPSTASARRLLEETERPVAAPSANPSGQISPTSAQHVAQGLGSKVALILDGGDCAVGVESTVISTTGGVITILRPGGVTDEDLAPYSQHPVQFAGEDSSITSPGMLLSHYAPDCPVRLMATDKKEGEAFVGFGPGTAEFETTNLSASADLREATARLFSLMHDLNKNQYKAIAFAPIPNSGLGVAINDRLKRAAAPRG